MKKKSLLLRLVVLVTAMMCALGAAAVEAYANYTSSNTTLTFYYDNYRSSRTGTTYDLNTLNNSPGWYTDGTNANVTKVVFNSSFTDARPTTTYFWFYRMENLQSITGLSYLNTSEVTNMSYMFASCTNLTSLDLSSFNTSKVTKANGLFRDCSSLASLDLSSFNTSKLTNMNYIFSDCTSLRTVYAGSGWTTAAVTSSYYMFQDCTNLVGGQGTTYDANHIDAAYAHIDGGPSNPGYFTAKGPEAYACYTSSNTTLTFYYDNQRSSRTGTTYDLNTGIATPGWKTDGTNDNVTKVVFNSSFANARPTTTYSWFYKMQKLQTITGMNYLNTSDVTRMDWMFADCYVLESLDVSHFNTAKVTNMSYMFRGCKLLTSLDVSSFNTSNVTTMESMFDGLIALTSLDLSDFNTANVTNMSAMFHGSSKLTSLDLSSFNTANVTDMSFMFNYCSGLTSLDVSSFNTAKVTNMWRMFHSCSGLTSLDLSSFNTANVTDMNWMFDGCYSLQTIYVGNGWSTAAVTSSNYMFRNCTSLVGGQGTTYDANNPQDKAYAHIDGGPSNPGYFTAATEAYACYTPSNTTLTFYYDNQRSSRTGTTYDLNTGSSNPGWYNDNTYASVTKVVFDPSFANARPTTTYDWFFAMRNLQSITGMSYLNTSEVTNMAFMFTNCSVLPSLDLSHFNTAKVTDMIALFLNCSKLTSLDVSGFNTAKVTDMRYMFAGGLNLQTIYVGNDWSTAAVTESSDMFTNCFNLVGGKGTTYNANHIDKEYAHIDGGPSNPGYFTEKGPEAYACYTSSNTTLTFYYDTQRSSRTGTTYDLNTDVNFPDWYTDGTNASVTKVVFDPSFAGARPTTTYRWFYYMENLQSITGMSYLNTSEVTNMAWMFGNCTVLTSLDVSHFNTSKVTDMSAMFFNCSILTSLDVSSFNTPKVTNMFAMFMNCRSLTSLDVSHFNTAKVTDMRYMFAGGLNLQTIYVGNDWSTAAVTESSDMFTNCYNLVGGKGTTYDANHIDKEYAHIDGGTSNPGYFTAKNAALRGDVNGDGQVKIDDVTALINLLLSGNTSAPAADCNLDGKVAIGDVTALINYLLSSTW